MILGVVLFGVLRCWCLIVAGCVIVFESGSVFGFNGGLSCCEC